MALTTMTAMARFLVKMPRPGNQLVTICQVRTLSETGSGEGRPKIVQIGEARRFMVDCMMSVGIKREASVALADTLVAADYRGHFSHGLNRLEMYMDEAKAGSGDGDAVPIILRETQATAWVDGKNGLGPVVGNFCMDIAIQKANDVGVGFVIAKGSNHYGIAGWYSDRAAAKGLIGITMTNTSPIVAPTRGKKAALGTNPLSVAAPGGFNLDMATSAVALGKVELARVKRVPIPAGWAIDEDGETTTNPAKAVPATSGVLLPLGGEESNSGYKGYGLGVVVELFCGILGGAAYGPKIQAWLSPDASSGSPYNLGQCFAAVDPDCFDPDWKHSLDDLLSILRGYEPIDPTKPVLSAGDPERVAMEQVDKQGGIAYHPNMLTNATRKFEPGPPTSGFLEDN